MIDEPLPGLYSWSAFHEGIRRPVHCAFVAESRTLLDPMEPEEGLDWFDGGRRPQRIVLSNRHHYRHSARFADRFGCPVLCHEAGLHEFAQDQPVLGFRFGNRVAADVVACEVGAICPDETALLIEVGDGALSVADGIIRGRDGELRFVPDELLGDDPEAVKRGLCESYRRVVERFEFDSLLFAHGAPVIGGASGVLADFVGI